jgi:hypothetical protein
LRREEAVVRRLRPTSTCAERREPVEQGGFDLATDHDAARGDLVPALARLLRQLRDRRRDAEATPTARRGWKGVAW